MDETEREKLTAEYSKIRVLSINMEKLNQTIDEWVKTKSKIKDEVVEGEVFSTMDRFALIEGTQILIDSDCVGEILKDDTVIFNVYGHRTIEKTRDMMPRVVINFKASEITEGELPITLPQFMAERFLYNSRVLNNMKIIAKEIKISKKSLA